MFRRHRLLVGAVVAALTLPLAVLAPARAHDVWTTELSGVMRAPGGAQAPGQVTAYRVNASGEVLETVSDDFLGPWSLSVPAGTYRISFSPDTSGLAGGWWQGKRTFETATQVTVTRGQQVSGLSHTFTGTGSISGSVTATGGVLQEGTVRAEGVGVEGGSAEYVFGGDSSESFSLTGLAPGTYDVFFEGLQANQVNQPVPRVTVSAGGAVAGVALSVRSGAHVYGTVTAGGQPVPYGSVYADRQEPDGSWTRVAEDETGPSGDFHLVRLRPGTHRIIMSPLGSDATGYGSFTTTVVVPSLDSFVEVNGALPAESRITGVVTGAGGRLVAGATVRALGSDGYGTDTTDAAGRYTITGLNAGTYRVEVDPPDSHDELETSVTGVGVGAGAQASRNIALQIGGSISGVITRSDGSFAAADVSAYRLVDGDWHYVAGGGSTKATGRYTLHALPPGQYRINTVRYTTSTFFVHEFYPDVHTIDEAQSITVGSGQALTGFDVMSGDGGPSILNTTAPSFQGTVRVGQALTADPGTWSHPGATFRYSWDTDDDQVGRSQTFKVTPDLLGEKLSLGVHASASYYTSGYASTAPVTVQPGLITNTSRPKISGTPRLGNTLKATVGKWSPGGVTASFRWYAGTQAIKKAKAQSLVLRKAQLGKRIKVRVTVVKDGYARTRVFSVRTKKVTR